MMRPLWTATELAAATSGTASTDFAVTGVAFDSREVGPGDLFIALTGDSTDGHRFLDQAFAQGAAGAIVSADTPQALGAPVGLVGAPLGLGSVTPGRCDLAPARLRATLGRIGRYDVDSGHELATQIADHGDVAIEGLTIEEATGPIRAACAASV